jgi:hypothetical protein
VTRLISQANVEARKTSSDNLAMDLVANCHLDRCIGYGMKGKFEKIPPFTFAPNLRS